MEATIGGGGADTLAGGTVGSLAGQFAGNEFLQQLALAAASAPGGGMQQGAGLLGGNISGPRQVPPLGQLVPPMLGQTTFPQLGQTSIMQVLQQLLGQPTGQFK